MVLEADADLAVILQNRKMHIGGIRTARLAQCRLKLRLRELVTLHHVSVYMPVMNEHLGASFHQAGKTLVAVRRIAHEPIHR